MPGPREVPPASRAALTAALGEMIQVLTDPRVTGSVERGFLTSCPMCRNRLLYLLDTAPYAGSAFHQFGRRIRALPLDHEMHAGRLDHSDSRFPEIRGLA